MIWVGLACAVAWAYLLLGRGWFWRVAPPDTVLPTGEPARIVAVVPARDEATGVAPAIGSLLAQAGTTLQVVLVDDQSSDGTAGLALDAARQLGAADRLHVISGQPLPAGWTGKLWAVRQGLERAAQLGADFYLLTDADIVHDPGHVAALAARAGASDMMSEMVLLRCRSLAERALLPAFVFFFLMLYPPAWTADARRKSAGAAGGCVLIRPAMLDRIGGIEAIRNRLIDDCALAASVKAAGGRLSLGVTIAARSVRAYDTPAEIWRMVSRTAFTQLGYSAVLLLGTLAGLFVTYLAPPLLLLFGHGAARWLGLGCWLAMSVAFYPTVRLYRLGAAWALLLPVIALFYSAATIGSAVAYWRGTGGYWKGRVQASPH